MAGLGKAKDTFFSSDADLDVWNKGTEYATTRGVQLANRRLHHRIVVDLTLERAQCLVEDGILLQRLLGCEFHLLKQRSHCFSVDHKSVQATAPRHTSSATLSSDHDQPNRLVILSRMAHIVNHQTHYPLEPQ